MRVPARLEPLLDQGVITEVLRPLMSGKEADVYLVVCQGDLCAAKVYKEANNRSFKHRSDYTEGRRTRNSRSQRAMNKRSKFGRNEIEQAWRNAEVDAIYRLSDAGVRVPRPYAYIDGVLVMELIGDYDGNPAPRLVDADLHPDEAWDLFHYLIQQVVAMLCAGIVHGDLSDFNVLLSYEGPVIIDFPQAVDPAHNRNARKLLLRDVQNLTNFLARYTSRLRNTRYGEEMWGLYEASQLYPDTELTGKFKRSTKVVETNSLLAEIEAMEEEYRRKREVLGLPPRRPVRQVPAAAPIKSIEEKSKSNKRRSKRRGSESSSSNSGKSQRTSSPNQRQGGAEKPRRPGQGRRRRGQEPQPRSSRGQQPKQSRAQEPNERRSRTRSRGRGDRSRRPERRSEEQETAPLNLPDDLSSLLIFD